MIKDNCYSNSEAKKKAIDEAIGLLFDNGYNLTETIPPIKQ